MTAYLVLSGSGSISVGMSAELLGIDANLSEEMKSGGSGIAYVMLFNVNIVIYFVLPLVVAVASSIFSSGAVKNEIAAGVSRVKFFVAKLILSVLLSVAALTVFIWGGVLAGTLLYGAGDWSGGYFAYVLKAFGSLTIIITAYCFVAVFLSFAVKNTGAVTGIYIAFSIGPQVILSLVGYALDNPQLTQTLLRYDLATLVQMYPVINMLSLEEIVRGYAIAAGYMLAAVAGGVALFKRAEIK
jgi:ABC-type transport system involved in multi-copper enzyme maturation permease subunit